MVKPDLRILIVVVTIALLVACSSTKQTIGLPQKTGNPLPVHTAYYYTANESGSISKLNALTDTVVETLKADGTFHNVQVSPNGKVLGATLIPKAGSQAESHDDSSRDHGKIKNGQALFYDTATNRLIKKVEVGSHPAHIVFTSDGKYVLVTNNGDNQVSIIDTATFQVKQTILTGKQPHGFRISSDNKFAYVANMGEDTVSVLNLAMGQEIRKIKIGQTPVTTGITSDGYTLLVTLFAENALAIVDLKTDKVEKIQVGTGPAQVYVQSDDKFAYVANQGTEQKPSALVTKIDLANRKVAATIETGKGAHGVVISPDNQKVYVTNMVDNTVSVIDGVINKVLLTVKVGNMPNGISYQP